MSYRAFWQRRCRAAAAGAVLKPSGGNCAVLPKDHVEKGACLFAKAQKNFQPPERVGPAAGSGGIYGVGAAFCGGFPHRRRD